ncbi:hypothetical protein [Arthrobacter sp. H14-L1]|uniref:hypothetical protein n=1 Tax=Arthrobacter sp. H14-L1 TaxID=2996697 RepID=UPI00226F6CB8|nr:hypothetical protein [Arthrobacter sp. H14-L1]
MKNGTRLIRIAAGWLLGLMLAVTAAAITIAVVNANHFGPQQPVREYFQALHDGNGAQALGLLKPTTPTANPAVLDGEGLSTAAAHLSDLQVGDPHPDAGGKVTVTASYSVDGAKKNTDFQLEPTGKQWLFFTTWSFVPAPLPTLDISVVNETTASLNGVIVKMPAGRNSFAVLYPGQYKAAFANDLFQAPAVSTTVTSLAVRPPAVDLVTAPSAKLLTAVNNQLQHYLDGCAKQQVLLPADCPLSNHSDNRIVSPVMWHIESYPKVSISAYGGEWVIAPLTVKAQVSYQEQQLYTGEVSQVKLAQNFGFTAKLETSGSNVAVVPVVNY